MKKILYIGALVTLPMGSVFCQTNNVSGNVQPANNNPIFTQQSSPSVLTDNVKNNNVTTNDTDTLKPALEVKNVMPGDNITTDNGQINATDSMAKKNPVVLKRYTQQAPPK